MGSVSSPSHVARFVQAKSAPEICQCKYDMQMYGRFLGDTEQSVSTRQVQVSTFPACVTRRHGANAWRFIKNLVSRWALVWLAF
jgi:hypothetical protein